MMKPAFFAEWAAAADALPLLLTGGEAALSEAAAQLKALFSATDIVELAPVNRTLSIKEIRAVHTAAAQRAWSGNRLIIIRQAEKLSLPASQALLKILEEPTRTSRFALTTSWYRRLPLTIRSRAIRVRVGAAKQLTNTEASPALPSSVIARLAAFAGDAPLSPETLVEITRALEQELRQRGPTPALKTAYTRLRDYHRITAEPGANHKLARDVLLASLPPAV